MKTIAAGLADSAALASTLSERLEHFVAPLLVRNERSHLAETVVFA